MLRRSEQQQLLEVIDDLYASVLDEAIFPTALLSLADYARAKGTFWLVADRESGRVRESLGVGTDPVVQHEYDTYYGMRDVRIPPALALPLGAMVTEATGLDRASFERSEIYQDFLVPHDIPHMLGVWAERTPTAVSAVSLQRTKRQGCFTDGDQRRLAVVMPHVLRAIQMRAAVVPLRQRQNAYGAVLDQLPFGVVFLDETGRVVDMSGPAEAILRDAQVLTCSQRRLSARNATDTGILQRALKAATRSSAPVGATIILQPVNGKRRVNISVVPMRSCDLIPASHIACIVVIYDPDTCAAPSAGMVSKNLRLTPAESRLACVLFAGTSLTDAAVQLGVSANTCKSQLKSIYAKTECRSHVELARTMLMAGFAQAE